MLGASGKLVDLSECQPQVQIHRRTDLKRQLYLCPGASGQGSPWRPRQRSGDRARPRAAGPAPGAQGRPAGEPRGIAPPPGRAVTRAEAPAPPEAGVGRAGPAPLPTPGCAAAPSPAPSSQGATRGPGRPRLSRPQPRARGAGRGRQTGPGAACRADARASGAASTKGQQPPQRSSRKAPRESAPAPTARELQLPGGFAARRLWTPFPRGRRARAVAQPSGKCSSRPTTVAEGACVSGLLRVCLSGTGGACGARSSARCSGMRS